MLYLSRFASRGQRLGLLLVLVLGLLLSMMPAAAMAAPVASDDGHHIYVVRPGDSLSYIAKYFGVTVSVLTKYNHLSDPSKIYVGQHLRIPEAGTGHIVYDGHPPVGCVMYHRVRHGDTLSFIAKWYGVNLHALAELNDIDNASLILVGQKICIPSAYKGVSRSYGHDDDYGHGGGYGYGH